MQLVIYWLQSSANRTFSECNSSVEKGLQLVVSVGLFLSETVQTVYFDIIRLESLDCRLTEKIWNQCLLPYAWFYIFISIFSWFNMFRVSFVWSQVVPWNCTFTASEVSWDMPCACSRRENQHVLWDCRLMPGWAMKPQDPAVEAGSLMRKALILTKHLNASVDASLSRNGTTLFVLISL